MSKKNYLFKSIFVIILLTTLSMFPGGCSNLPEVSSYNVIITVMDESDVPLEGAVITMEGASKTTNNEGVATFSKPDGSYDYNIIAKGYVSVYSTAVVNGDNEIIFLTLNQLLEEHNNEYNIHFIVKDIYNVLIEDATVIIDGENKLTDSNGMVTFIRPEGTYNYTVEASEYNTANDNIIVNESELYEVINLFPDGYKGIYDWVDLNNIRNDLSKNYILMNDLDSSTSGYDDYANSTANGGKGWKPIENFSSAFYGNDYTISELYINRPLEDKIGLFASIHGVVTNLGLKKINITGNNYVGGLTGYLYGYDDLIENCYSTGNISGGSNLGGLIGWAEYINIENCYASVDISGSDGYIGGLIGYQRDTQVFFSYANGDVSGIFSVGGLIGCASGDGFNQHTYAIGQVDGVYDIGGLVGENYILIRDSFSLLDNNSNIIGNNGGYLKGRVLPVLEYEMQSNQIYTERVYLGYPDMNAPWESKTWNFGTNTDPAYPTLSWE